jgi:putative intracellular protease/amidase/GNAT superfamily N-acetyltransferase
MKTIGILIFDDVEELDFAGPYEVFGMAARFGADCRTLLIAEERREVRCRHGMRVAPDATIDDAPALDILIVPGGLGARTHARSNPKIIDFVRKQNRMVASVCTGALILSNAGLLDGLTATTHHAAFDLLRENPRIDVREGTRFIIQDRIATSAGVSAGIDLALALVAREWDAAVSAKVASNMEWEKSEVYVRRATQEDADAVLACMREAFAPYKNDYTKGAYEDTVPDSVGDRLETMSVFVAIYDDKIIGTIACAKHGADGHLRGMAVRSTWRGKGAAAALLRAAEDELRKQGCHRVTFDTTEPLHRAMRFYEKHGFRKTGRITDFFGMPLIEHAKDL